MSNTGTTTYPATLDDYTNVGTATLENEVGYSHQSLHNQVHEAIEAIESTVGTTAGTGVLTNFSAGDLAARVNNETFGTVDITGGTISSVSIGTPAITGGTISSPSIFSPEINTGGTITAGSVNTALFVNQDYNAPAINIDSEAGTAHVVYINGQNTSGALLYMINNAAQTAGKVIDAYQDNVNTTEAVAEFHQNGLGNCLVLDMNGTADALSIDNAGPKRGINVFSTVSPAANMGLVRVSQDAAATASSSYTMLIQNAIGAIMPVLIINNSGTAETILTDDGAKLTAAGVWTDAPSYRVYKENQGNIVDIVGKLKSLDVDIWKYKDEEIDGKNRYKLDQARHCSPYQDDFFNTFKLGKLDEVNPMDYIGVIFTAVKDLIKRIEELEKK